MAPRDEAKVEVLEKTIAALAGKAPDWVSVTYRRASGDKDRTRSAQDAAYRFMTTMAGNRPNYEDAIRALFAHDRRRFATLIADWPADIRDHAIRLAYSDQAD